MYLDIYTSLETTPTPARVWPVRAPGLYLDTTYKLIYEQVYLSFTTSTHPFVPDVSKASQFVRQSRDL